jgi:hypothetical protein
MGSLSVVEETPDAFVFQTPDGRQVKTAKSAFDAEQVAQFQKQVPLPAHVQQELADIKDAAPSSPAPPPQAAPPPALEAGKTDTQVAKETRAASVPPPAATFYQPGQGGSGPAGGPAGAMQASVTAQVPSFQPRPVGQSGKALGDAYSQQQKAVGEKVAVEQQNAAAESARIEADMREADARQARQAEREAQRQAFVAKREGDLEATMKAAQDSVGEVDQSHWWNTRNTGQKILAGISAFLSGFGGGPNYVRDAIQQDIALQRESLDRRQHNKEKAVGNATTLLEVTRARFGDEVASEKAAEATALAQAQRRAELFGAKAAGNEAKAKAQELSAGLEIQKQQALAEFRARWTQLAIQQEGVELQRYELGIKANQREGGLTAKDLQGQVEGFGKDVQPLARASSAIQTLDGVATKKGDIPGVGAFDSRKPSTAEGEEDVKVRQAREQLGAVIQQVMSGAGASDAEIQRRLKSYGLDEHASEKEFRAGYPSARAFVVDQLRVINGKYDPRAVQVFKARGGLIPGEAPTGFAPKGG